MLMDAILDQFWPEHGHNFSAGVNLQLRPNNNREIVQIDLGIYMQPLQRMPRRPAHGGRAGGRAEGGRSQHFITLGASLQRRCRIADEDAIHRLIGCKGSSGIKPCLMCRNVFLKGEVRDIVASDRTGVAVHHCEPDASKLQPMTTPVLEAICHRLRDAADSLGKGDFQELERRLGWTWDPGLTQRIHKLRPLSVVMFDWMHCIFVNGTYNVLVFQIFKLLKKYGVRWERADSYFREWNFPGCATPTPDTYAIFAEKRAKSHWEGKHFKCTASEGLATMQVSWYASHIRIFGHAGLQGVLRRGCAAALLGCMGCLEEGALQRFGCGHVSARADWRVSSGISPTTLQRPRCGRPAQCSRRTRSSWRRFNVYPGDRQMRQRCAVPSITS